MADLDAHRQEVRAWLEINEVEPLGLYLRQAVPRRGRLGMSRRGPAQHQASGNQYDDRQLHGASLSAADQAFSGQSEAKSISVNL